MARKDLLKGLMGGPAPVPPAPQPEPAVEPPTPPLSRGVKGAIGAVSQSIAELKSRAILDVAPDLIDDAGLKDRLDADAAGIAELAQSISRYGQQVPVLLRPSPRAEGRYDIVYGRRRVAALKSLGQPVKAMIRDLKDRDLILAQGQENAARKDLSFIEKANFARQMRDAGFERALICDALSVDKTVISRMLAVIDTIPLSLLRAIGSAPSAGRNRWLELADALSQHPEIPLTQLEAAALGDSSDERFAAVLRAARPAAAPAAPRAKSTPEPLYGKDRCQLGQIERRSDRTQITLSKSAAPGFDDWLIEQMDRLHQTYLSTRS